MYRFNEAQIGGQNKQRKDCKMYSFREIRNLSDEEVDVLLGKCESGELPLTSLNNVAKELKSKSCVRNAIVKSVGMKNWQEVEET